MVETINTRADDGQDAGDLLEKTTRLLFSHSLFNGHPKFWGYITSSPAPLGVLGDLLAAAVNANAGAYVLSPVATEIEKQTINWIGQFMGYPTGGGLKAVLGGKFVLRMCIVNFRTTVDDIDTLPGYIRMLGEDIYAKEKS